VDAHLTEQFRARLTERLSSLEARLDQIESALDQAPPADAEDRATEREDDEVMEHLGQVGLTEIEQIKAALRRIDEGTFGICAACENDISVERLEAIPHATRCRHCA